MDSLRFERYHKKLLEMEIAKDYFARLLTNWNLAKSIHMRRVKCNQTLIVEVTLSHPLYEMCTI